MENSPDSHKASKPGIGKNKKTNKGTNQRKPLSLNQCKQTYWADVLNAAYFRRGLTCTIGSTNDFIDGGQPRDKNGS